MPTIIRFEEIEAWKTARELTRMVYSLTEQGSFARDYGLKNQIQRAAVSVMSNIAASKAGPRPNSWIIWAMQKHPLAKYAVSSM